MQDITRVVWVLLFLFLSACTKQDPPPQNSPVYRAPVLPKEANYQFVRYTVQKGDTVSSIALRYNASIVDIMTDNNLKRSDEIFIGTILKIRAVESKPKSIEANYTSEFKQKYQDIQSQPTSQVRRGEGKVFVGEPNYARIPRSTGYSKPIVGGMIAGFSSSRSGRPLMGVEINSPHSQSVKAIHNGVISFVSENFAGFGRCVAVSHSRTELAFFYGLSSCQVKVGDIVTRGAPIGKIDTGHTLGIKVLRNGAFQDPKKIIPNM